MKTFEIEIKETLIRRIKIKSNSLDEAMDKVKERYKKERYVLDYSDFVDTDFDISTFTKLENSNEFSNFILQKAEEMISSFSLEELARIGFGDCISALQKYNSINNDNKFI